MKGDSALQRKTVIYEKIKESLSSVLPISLIVAALAFSIAPVPNGVFLSFAIGALMLICGMGLFTLGTELAMTPIGQYVGSAVTRSRKLWLIIGVSFVMGTLVTVSEPDLQVLASQVPNIPDMQLIISVAVGVGLFLVVAMLRILFKIKLSYLLSGLYVAVFALAYFVPPEFLAVAFDSGGVTTGPMTVPFIMALGVGVAASRTDKNAEEDSFGLVALGSVGPVIAVLILGMIFKPENGAYVLPEIADCANSRELIAGFLRSFPAYFEEVALSLLPITVFFFIFQLCSIRLSKSGLLRILSGVLYTYVGLVLFLTGANVGFMPAGRFIGEKLALLPYNWVLVPVGMLVGFFIVNAEPAVHVLSKQVAEISSGAISERALMLSMSVGVCAAVGLSMLRIICNIPIMYILIPGYAIAIVLTFISPPIFTAIAFDSGGVASGPMTATFSVPLAIGACAALGGNIMTDAFGVVALVAMTPLITIMTLGCICRVRMKKTKTQQITEEEEIIEL